MRFKKSFCTNTRLMGTMMLMAEWYNEKNEVIAHIFMLDAEGLGISDFYLYEGLDFFERDLFYKKKYGGLGGMNIDLQENELLYLVNQYLYKNINYKKKLPEKMTDDIVNFYMEFQSKTLNKEILDGERKCNYENAKKHKEDEEISEISENGSICEFSKKKLRTDEGWKDNTERFKRGYKESKQDESKRFEKDWENVAKGLEHELNIDSNNIFGKISKKFESDIEFVQYMLMRFVARDSEALYHYSGRKELSKLHISNINGALLYSHAERMHEGVYKSNFVYEDSDGYYKASAIIKFEKIIEKSDKDFIFTNKIDRIAKQDEYKYFLRSIMILSDYIIDEVEVEYLMEKKEQLDVYNFSDKISQDDIKNLLYEKFARLQEVEFDGEILYTQYFPDNSHVEDSIYRINSDIMFNIFIRNKNLYLFSYDEEYRELLYDFIEEIFGKSLELNQTYEFEMSILLDFIYSKCTDIEKFIYD